jgi:hypothetical protein
VKLVGESVSADFMAAERTFTGLLKWNVKGIKLNCKPKLEKL